MISHDRRYQVGIGPCTKSLPQEVQIQPERRGFGEKKPRTHSNLLCLTFSGVGQANGLTSPIHILLSQPNEHFLPSQLFQVTCSSLDTNYFLEQDPDTSLEHYLSLYSFFSFLSQSHLNYFLLLMVPVSLFAATNEMILQGSFFLVWSSDSLVYFY